MFGLLVLQLLVSSYYPLHPSALSSHRSSSGPQKDKTINNHTTIAIINDSTNKYRSYILSYIILLTFNGFITHHALYDIITVP